jgi:hypothetical protein
MDRYSYSKDIQWLHYNGNLKVILHRQLRFVSIACYLIILLFYVTRSTEAFFMLLQKESLC